MDITDPLKKIMARCLDFLKKNTTGRFLGTKVSHFLDRSYIAYIHDVVMATVSIVLSLLLRVGDSILYYEPFIIFKHMIIYGLISAGIFLWMGIYRGVWRYTSLSDLMAIGLSVTCASVVYAPLMLFMGQTAALPRSLVAINWFVSLALISGTRLAYRLFGDKKYLLKMRLGASHGESPVTPIVIIGVNDQSEMFVREMKRTTGVRYKVIGFIDNDARRIGRNLHGIEILGSLSDLPRVLQTLHKVQRQKPEMLLIADPTLRGKVVQKILDHQGVQGIVLARLPMPREMPQRLDQEFEIKPISIEDLLGRPQATLDRVKMRGLVEGKKVLVTGAGGSIGSELVRQICAFNPAHLTIVDHSEYLLYTIDQELKELAPQLSQSKYLCDVSDSIRVNQIFQEHRPQVVFHAAALKHVPIAEDNKNETALTNIIGTRNVAEACGAVQSLAMVLISTDKVIAPTSFMGATKRLCESYCQALNIHEATEKKRTRFITVRFGNVLGSAGSVVPLFQRQIKQGGPLKVTHPDMKRYFMTIHEAVELVLQAAALGSESAMTQGEIFVLDMGEPVKIVDLATQMIQLAGLKVHEDIKIEFTGIRPGEKLFEELFDPKEKLLPSGVEGIFIATPRSVHYQTLVYQFKELEKVARQRHTEETLRLVKSLVPDYKPEEAPLKNMGSKNLDPKASGSAVKRRSGVQSSGSLETQKV